MATGTLYLYCDPKVEYGSDDSNKRFRGCGDKTPWRPWEKTLVVECTKCRSTGALRLIVDLEKE